MKKSNTWLNISLLLIFMVLVWAFIVESRTLSSYIREVIHFVEKGEIQDQTVINLYVMPTVEYSILVFFNFLAIFASVFIFIYCNPKLFRRSTWTNLSAEWAQNKSERIAAKQAKAEAEKQKQIAELEQKLDELKKD